MVKAAHLQPLDKKENVDSMAYQKWNPNTTRADFYNRKNDEAKSNLESEIVVPKNAISTTTKALDSQNTPVEVLLERLKNKTLSQIYEILTTDTNFIQNSKFYEKVLTFDVNFLEIFVSAYREFGVKSVTSHSDILRKNLEILKTSSQYPQGV